MRMIQRSSISFNKTNDPALDSASSGIAKKATSRLSISFEKREFEYKNGS